MRIWIDMHNSPHPLLFAPVVRRLEDEGNVVLVTARDNAQTLELTRERWPRVAVIGGSSPRGRRAKTRSLARRIHELGRWAKAERPHMALSHNSYAQIVAARSRGLPVVTAMDFEHQPANHLAFRLAHRVLLPDALRPASLRRQGATASKTIFYPGLKEEIYLGDFEPDARVLDRLGLRGERNRLVVARTPPDRALYHRMENSLFLRALWHLDRMEGARCIVLARYSEQRVTLESMGLTNTVIPAFSVDSRSLMSHADLVLGAGGTMTREAALLGVRTYSLFAGPPPLVDRWLESKGLLARLESVDQLDKAFESRPRLRSMSELRARSGPIIDVFAKAALAAGRT